MNKKKLFLIVDEDIQEAQEQQESVITRSKCKRLKMEMEENITLFVLNCYDVDFTHIKKCN